MAYRFCRMLVVIVPTILAPQNAFAGSAYEDELFKVFEKYFSCGVEHFTDLGFDSKDNFETVEATVAKKCGAHIKQVRRKLKLNYGIKNRTSQNDFINNYYKSQLAPWFRRAFEDSKGFKAELDFDRQKEKSLKKAWLNCLIDFATDGALGTAESATTIARASFSYCQNHEDSLNELYKNVSSKSELLFSLKEDFEGKLLAFVIKVRSNPPQPKHKPLPGLGT